MHAKKVELETDLEDASIEDIPHIRRRLRIIDSVLNDTDPDDLMSRTGDPQIDKWLDELDAGVTPDLTEGMDPRFLRGKHGDQKSD